MIKWLNALRARTTTGSEAGRMDKDMAIAYLQTLKNRSPGEARLAMLKESGHRS